jgi:hypothetical protein
MSVTNVLTDLGSVYYSQTEAVLHAEQQRWRRFVEAGEQLAVTEHRELLRLRTSRTGRLAWFWEPVRETWGVWA